MEWNVYWSKIEYKDKEYFYFNIMYILYNCINVREGWYKYNCNFKLFCIRISIYLYV